VTQSQKSAIFVSLIQNLKYKLQCSEIFTLLGTILKVWRRIQKFPKEKVLIAYNFNITVGVVSGSVSSVGIATDYGLDGPGSNLTNIGRGYSGMV